MPSTHFPAITVRLILVCLIAALFAGDLAAGTIKGTATDSASGVPLPNMTVQAYNAIHLVVGTKITDSAGRYSMSVPAGQYRVLSFDSALRYATAFGGNAPSYEETPPIAVDAVSTATADLAMSRGGTIAGSVTVSGSTGVSGVTIAAYNLPSGTRRGWTSTAADGSFSLLLPPGTYKLAAYEEKVPAERTYGVLFSGDSVTFEGASPVDVAATQTVTVNFHVQRAGILNGMVVSGLSNAPLSGITVYAFTSSGLLITTATTGAGGVFLFSLPPGETKVMATDSSSVYASGFPNGARSFAKSPTITVGSGTNPPQAIVLEPAGRANGRVSAAVGGAPLSAIQIAAYNLDGTLRAEATTDNVGRYTLLLPTGKFIVAAFDGRLAYATSFYPSKVVFDAASPIAVVAGQDTDAVDFALVRAGRVIGVVTAADSGVALPNIAVSAYDQDGRVVASTQTSTAGVYVLALTAGSYRLLASDLAGGYANAFDGGAAAYESIAPRTVVTEGTDTANFVMRRGVKLAGLVVSSRGPIEGVEVSALDGQGRHVGSFTTSEEGRFSLTLLPGGYRLSCLDHSHRYPQTFYDHALNLEAATVVVVTSQTPPPILWTLTAVQRHRSVAH